MSMTRERWTQVERIYLAAMEHPPADRAFFVAEQCHGDDALLGEVESLLAANAEAAGFLDTPALGLAARALSEASTPAGPGRTVGPYQLLAPLGAGGMGEVWKARDPRVGRDVAIKFCGEQFTERFEREARAIAALNHPNICQLYDIGPNYLVMEMIEGERPTGPMPLATALRYARQIADALDAAHEKGIVHCDIKPDNVKIRPDGTVKVLDFGLAKLGIKVAVSAEPASLGTPPHSGVAGTAAYMSPEQMRGEEADKRTDIWSFGVLLYEMLTGERPFERPTFAETRSAVQEAEVDYDRVPATARRVLGRCLEKDPKKRLRDIGDVWELLEGSPAELPARRVRWRGWIAAGILALMAAAGLWVGLRSREPELKPLVRFEVDLGDAVSMSLAGADPILSADGSRVGYVSQGRLYTRRMDESEARELPAAQGATSPFFSPDGQWIAFSGHGKLRKVSVNGGDAIDICRSTAAFTGGAWGEDNNIIASRSATGPLWRVPANGGEPQAVTKLDGAGGEASHRLPQILPGGKAVIFTAHNSITGFDEAKIEVITLGDHRRKTLIRGGTYGRYLPSGHLIYVNRGRLFAVGFDIDRLEVRGKPALMLDQVIYSPQFGSASISFSRGGTLLYRSGGVGTRMVTVGWLDSGGVFKPLLPHPGMFLDPRLSPDGKRLAVAAGEGADKGLWVYDTERETATRVLSSDSMARAPVWTPDGRFLVYRSDGGIGLIPADGAGKPSLLTRGQDRQLASSFTADGHWLALESVPGGGGMSGSDIWTLPIENSGTELRAGTPAPYLQTPFDEYHPSFSPDGRWLAYTSDESGTFQVYVRGFPDTRGKVMISIAGGLHPKFSPAGPELFFVNPAGQIMVVRYVIKGDSLQAERPRLWSERRLVDLGIPFDYYDVAPDGKRIIALMPAEDPGAQHAQNHIVFLENFFDELQRRVPANR
jgi:serine/threonine-protein kinase